MRRDLPNNVLRLWAGFNRFLQIFSKNKQELIFDSLSNILQTKT